MKNNKQNRDAAEAAEQIAKCDQLIAQCGAYPEFNDTCKCLKTIREYWVKILAPERESRFKAKIIPINRPVHELEALAFSIDTPDDVAAEALDQLRRIAA